MKKHVLSTLIIALIAFLVVGCTNKDSTDGNSELPETTDPQEQPEDQFAEYTGKIAIITEDVVLKDPYMITVDSDNNQVYQRLENEEFTLNKNDMVIVIEEHGNECRVVQAFGDIPRLRGTIEESKLSYDESLFKDNANQAIVDGAMSYDGIDGNEKGIQYGIGLILEREEDWVKMVIPMQESELWFKSDSLSYDFDTSVIDIKN